MKGYTLRVLAGISLFAALMMAGPSTAQEPAEEEVGRAVERGPGKIYALFAFDTDDPFVGKSLQADHVSLTQWFAKLGKSRIAGGAPVVLTGSAANGPAILSHCKRLRVRPNDVIFVYIGCHGEKHGAQGHAMRFGKVVLVRSDLVKVLKAKAPHLLVLITDSCYGGFETPTHKREVTDLARAPHPKVMEDLFFGAVGVVNINSCAPGEYAWSGKHGGLMTESFVEVCSRSPAELGKTGGARVTWQDVFLAVRNLTVRGYTEFKGSADPAMRGYDKLREQTRQTVYAFEPFNKPIASAGKQGGVPEQTDRKVFIHVTVPAEATLYFDGARTSSIGTERLFVTPPLSPDRTYFYTLTAERLRNGSLERVTRRVAVRGGEITRVAIQFPSAAARDGNR